MVLKNQFYVFSMNSLLLWSKKQQIFATNIFKQINEIKQHIQ